MTLDSLKKRVEALEQVVDPDGWPEIRTAILTALDPYPDAKDAIASALLERRGGDHQSQDWPETWEFILFTIRLDYPEAAKAMVASLVEVGVIDCPRCAYLDALSEEEIDRDIARLERGIDIGMPESSPKCSRCRESAYMSETELDERIAQLRSINA